MSFRATYEINRQLFYSSRLGGPKGMTKSLHQLNALPNKADGMAERFIRANSHVEFANGRYKEMEYHYILNEEGELKGLKKLHATHSHIIRWQPFFQGHWVEFVNRFNPDNKLIHLYRFLVPAQELIMTVPEFKTLIATLSQEEADYYTEQAIAQGFYGQI